ncbi:MAG: phenylalanine--tRNA ligase subunit beta [Nitrospirae bacterium]|nr:phenylalanine--tRNA ligase subunit beta [Nitrospirota bacterium]
MRASLEWLREFVPVGASAGEVAHRLTMLGLEVEAVEQIDGDNIFEINVTPNRPDCLSMIGVARELSAAFGAEITFPDHEFKSETGELDFNVDILNSALCPRYAGRIVKGLKIGPSPDWLKIRLEKCGIRSINNVVDVTNYVLLELGHPLHAFDLGCIKGHRISVGTPKDVKGSAEKLRFLTLDGNERELPEDALLIWDAERPIAIAGVMGGLETEVSGTTVDIFIESAYFDPVSVRRTSRATGLKTEASFRFERGADIKMLKKALDRTAFLMHKIAGGTIYGKIDVYPAKYTAGKISVNYEKINRVLGLDLADSEITGYLGRLGFVVEKVNGRYDLTPPPFRVDMQRDADIIEEIARVYGYERIPAVLPAAVTGIEGQDNSRASLSEALLKEMKGSFLKSGFTEVINYSFMGENDLDLLGIDAGDVRRMMVRIKNPLRAEDACMRTTLIPALIKNIVYNVSHGNKSFRLFEISRAFLAGGNRDDKLPEERNHFAAALYREKIQSLYRDDTPDFFVVKGVIEALFNSLKIAPYSFIRSAEPFLHPGQSADILIAGSKVGYIGALSPVVVGRLDIKAQRPSIILTELDIDLLSGHYAQSAQMIRYSPLPRYPFSERDTALIVDESLESSEIVDLLKSYSSDLIEGVTLFDVYKGKNIPEGKKSIAFSIRYRASDRTLKDEEVEDLHNQIVGFMIGRTKGLLRT